MSHVIIIALGVMSVLAGASTINEVSSIQAKRSEWCIQGVESINGESYPIEVCK